MTASLAPMAGVILLAESSALDGAAHRSGADDERLIATVRAAIDGGIRTVIVRDKDRPPGDRAALVAAISRLLHPVGGIVLLASDDGAADPLGADGLHLSAQATPGPATPAHGRSTHDASEIATAVAEGAAYLTVSPVYPSESKPGYGPALGPSGLAALVEVSPVPVVALGGITTASQVAECVGAGVAAVAVMGAILRSPDPAATAAALLSGEEDR